MPPIDPLLSRLVVPALATVIVAAVVRLIGGPGVGSRAAALGVPVAVIAAYAVDPGWPWAPPSAALDKLAWLALAGALIGVLIDVATNGRVGPVVAGFLWPGMAVAWLVGPGIVDASGNVLYRYAEVALVLGLVMARLHQIRGDAVSAPITGGAIAAGVAAVALVSGGPPFDRIGLPVAAAVLGWIVCNWPNRRLEFGAAGLLGGLGAGVALTAHAALFTRVNTTLVLIALLPILIQPIADRVLARNAFTRGEAVRPLALAVLLAVPGAVATLLALLAPGLVPDFY